MGELGNLVCGISPDFVRKRIAPNIASLSWELCFFRVVITFVVKEGILKATFSSLFLYRMFRSVEPSCSRRCRSSLR